jgi:hypothetical protein
VNVETQTSNGDTAIAMITARLDGAEQAAVLAAASTDPTVRSLVLRLTELQQEANDIRNFLVQYQRMHAIVQARGQTRNGEDAQAVRQAPTPMPRHEFVPAIRKILRDTGRRMKPSEIYAEFRKRYPAYAFGGSDALRKRLHESKQFFDSDNAGWWPSRIADPVAEA